MILQRSPRRIRPLSAVALSAALTATALSPGGPDAAAARAPAPLVWGAHVRETGSQTAQQAVTDFEGVVGQQLRAIRVFSRWGERVPDRFESWLVQTNRLMLFSVKPTRPGGGDLTWSSIANAAPGSTIYNEIAQLGADLKAIGQPIYLTLHHEPEAAINLGFGNADDFTRAWRAFVGVIRAQGATNVKFLWTMTDYAFAAGPSDRQAADDWYPGDDVVDALGADAYNWYTCRGRNEGWRSLQELIEPFRQFGARHPTKELWLPEYGTMDDPSRPNRKAEWLDEATALFSKPGWEQFRGVAYFQDVDPRLPGCDPRVTTSQTSISAFGRMGSAAIFSAPGGGTGGGGSGGGGSGGGGGGTGGGTISDISGSATASVPGKRLRPT